MKREVSNPSWRVCPRENVIDDLITGERVGLLCRYTQTRLEKWLPIVYCVYSYPHAFSVLLHISLGFVLRLMHIYGRFGGVVVSMLATGHKGCGV
jgi:hypothetical protein